MGQRGRKSSAALMIAPSQAVQSVDRPEPPDELTEEQARVWFAVVDSMPADWFGRETHELLSQYCRHTIAARRVSQLIAAHESGEDLDVDEYDRLLKMQEREGRALSSLATRMRMTQQTQYDKSKKRGSGAVKKPWES